MTRKKIGVISGGQLALMLGEASKNLDVELSGQMENVNCPAARVCKNLVICTLV